MLRYTADRRTIIYLLIIVCLLFLQWNYIGFNIFLYIVYLFFSISVSVIAHNHNHLPIWKKRWMNIFTDYYITLFYGFPAFGWVPTHNKNHHRYNNREGDYTLTYRYSEENNIGILLTYPSVSGYHQQKPIRDYLRQLYHSNRNTFYVAIFQYVALGLQYAIAFWLDWQKALLFVVIPQQVALFTVLIFNYIQHVHANEESEWNHSRNFVGILNLMLFNNGYHTVHHEKAGMHWSKLKEEHERIQHNIDPLLNERSMWWYLIRVYILGVFVPKFRTNSMRLERLNS
ncbi:MAG: fatty acid desaturase [Candidatus Kapabacteria bacterium]|nr:fatty acid desaturase [Candidatus Kapabacteria bacterium]